MRKLSLFLLTLITISCSSESSEPEDAVKDEDPIEEVVDEPEEGLDESLIPDLLVLGRNLEESGFLSNEIFQWEFTNSSEPIPPINLISELGIGDLSSLRSYFSEQGIVIFNTEDNPDTGFRDYFPYFKNFDTGAMIKFDDFVGVGSLLNGWVQNNTIIGLYFDPFTYNEDDFTNEFLLKRIIAADQSEQTLGLGRYRAGETFDTARIGSTLYIYHRADLSGDLEATLFVVDLDNFEILDTIAGLPEARFNMINDLDKNCYLFSNDLILKYDLQSASLDPVQVPGSTVFLSMAYSGNEVQQLIFNDKCFFAALGAQPGPAFTPAIYDLESGEVSFIDISTEITQFEGDEFPWDPTISVATMDLANNQLLMGVRSRGFPAELSSYAIFAVDFEGIVLEKKQIPLVPIALYPLP